MRNKQEPQTRQLLDEMPKRIKSSPSTAEKHKLTTPLRRSLRILHQNSHYLNSEHPKPTKNRTKCSQKSPTEPRKSKERPLISEIQVLGSRKSPRLSNRAERVSNLRRSTRLSLLGSTNGHDGSKKCSVVKPKKLKHFDSVKSKENKEVSSKKSGDSDSKKLKPSASAKSNDDKVVLRNKVKWRKNMGSCDESMQRSERRTHCCKDVPLVIGLKAVNRRDVCERNQEIRVTGKRKRGEEANKESVKGWTREQEMALQRAYIVTKPTPNFWKRVSKLVPGKSAKDCFDKVHSDHITPPQPLPQSRAKKINSSPVGCFSLSASKLLGPDGLKVKRASSNKQKSRVTRKTVRQLLQKHNGMDLNHEADLFPILEPNVNSSGQDSEPNNMICTPQQLQEKKGFLQKCHQRSSSGQKNALSRFSSSSVTDLSSPPVLKQVKNRALHEKYIDQLHSREAKRKAASARAGKENNGPAYIPKTDTVRAAKNALVSDAIDAIKQLQRMQTSAKSDSSDPDDDDRDIDNDDEGDGN